MIYSSADDACGSATDGTGQADSRQLRPTSEIARAIFADPDTRAFEQHLALLAPTDATVLIIGETGTGKEVAARELHALSGRRGPFLAVNCAALSETLAEAELFGHERGAYTGATSAQPGWFEAASGGTLLLDEVGDLPLRLQAKLLRVLQEREVTRVGSRVSRPIDARMIAATNIDLNAAVARGGFRRDLLFRLNVAVLHLRPLRERRQDIEPLALQFLDRYGEKFGRSQVFAPEAMRALMDHDWPGNVRELDNVIHRAVLLSTTDTLTASDLSLRAAPPGELQPRAPVRPPLEEALRGLAEAWVRDREPNLLQRVTRAVVQAGFDSANGNQVRAAELLGVSRNTLRTQLAHLGVIAPRRRTIEGDGRDPGQLRIGFQKFGLSGLLRFDDEFQALLAAEGLEVEWRDFPAGPPLVASLQSGQIDIGWTGEIPPIVAQANGAPVVYLACEPPAPRSVAVVVRQTDAILDAGDLRGRRVALSRGANVHFLLVRALEAQGLTLSDIEPVYLPPRLHPSPETIASVDAWAMWDPFLSAIANDGNFRILVDGTGLVANRRFCIARRPFLEAMPGIATALLEAMSRAARMTAQDPASVAIRLAEVFKMKPEGLELAMRRVGPGPTEMGADVIADQQKIADHLFALGLIPRPIVVADAVGGGT